LFYILFFLINYKKDENYKIQIEIFIGDWGLGIGPNPQSPIPNPQFKVITLYYIKHK